MIGEKAVCLRRKCGVAMVSTLAIAIASGSFAGTALAQDAPAPPADAAAGQPDEEILVTAARRETRLVDTPVSVQAFTAERLEQAGISHLYDIVRVTPGLRMDLLGTNLQPTIRGITTAVSGTGNAMNTAIYVDGIYQPSNLSNGLDLADIQQIEVVKGPQGTLFGRNATAGAILVTTERPDYDLRGRIEGGYGMYDDKRASVFVTGGLSESLASSLSIVYRNSDGFTRSVLNGDRQGFYHTITVRGKLLFEPTDSISFLLTGRYSRANDPEGRIYRIVGAASTAISTPGAIYATDRYTNGQGLTPKSETRVKQLTLQSTFDFGGATLNSYTSYQNEDTDQQTDLDGSSKPITDIRTQTSTRTFSQELILASAGSGSLQWTAGLNYFYQMDDAPYWSLATLANPNPVNARAARIDTNAYAAFADVTYEVTPGLFLTGGARYSIERKDFLFGLANPRTVNTDHRWNSFTPRAVVRYELTPSSNVYGSYSKGFKSGTFNASSSSTVPVNPETINAFEVGYKTSQSGFSFSTAAYYYEYSNLQVSAYDFLASPPVTRLQNAGRAEIYGIEGDISLRLTPQLRGILSGAYTHARYKEFPGAIAWIPNATNTAYATRTVDAAGNQMMRAPDFTGNFSLTYDIPTSVGMFQLTPSVYKTTSFYTETASQFLVPGYALVDMNINWTSPDDRWKVSVIGKNVLNKYYISYWDPLGAALMIADGAPRTVRASIAYKF